MLCFVLLLFAIPTFVSANPVPQNLDDLSIDPNSLPVEEPLDAALSQDPNIFYDAGCPKGSSTKNLSDENIDNSQDVIFRRSTDYCPPTGYQLPPTQDRKNDEAPQTLTSPSNTPSDRTQTGSSDKVCKKSVLPAHVSCSGPEVLNELNKKIDFVLNCVPGKFWSQSKPTTVLNA